MHRKPRPIGMDISPLVQRADTQGITGLISSEVVSCRSNCLPPGWKALSPKRCCSPCGTWPHRAASALGRTWLLWHGQCGWICGKGRTSESLAYKDAHHYKHMHKHKHTLSHTNTHEFILVKNRSLVSQKINSKKRLKKKEWKGNDKKKKKKRKKTQRDKVKEKAREWEKLKTQAILESSCNLSPHEPWFVEGLFVYWLHNLLHRGHALRINEGLCRLVKQRYEGSETNTWK